VSFENVPAFAVHLGREIEVPELGSIPVDVAWGGMFYVLADAERLGIPLIPEAGGEIARAGEMIKAAAREQLPVRHPENPDFPGITIAQLTGPPRTPGGTARNAVVVSTGELDWKRPSTWTGALDRSPCGTGTSARMGALFARGELGLHQDFHHEGILGTIFTGRLIRKTRVGEFEAVVPTISGTAWITGFAQYVVDPEDPFPNGYTVGDIWGGHTG
jgi:proline racemase